MNGQGGSSSSNGALSQGGGKPLSGGQGSSAVTQLPVTVYPNLAGAVSMICYMLPVTTVPTSFTANIGLGGSTPNQFTGIPVMNENTDGFEEESDATVAPIGGVTEPGSFTSVTDAITTCAPTGT